MVLETVMFLAAEKFGPSLIKLIGKEVFNRILPPIERARKSAIKRMAQDLSDKFPSVNFLEYNFQFNSPVARKEIEKLTSDVEMPDENILKGEMIKETATQWPQYSDHAKEIVEVFVKHFEAECLKTDELKSLTLASIIRKGNTATQELVQKYGEEAKERDKLLSQSLQSIQTIVMTLKGPDWEPSIARMTSLIENKLIRERDELLDKTRRWESKDLYDKLEALAREVIEFRHDISPDLAGSIYRLCASYNLRSFKDKEKARYWMQLAEEAEPSHHKTLALKAELLCLEENWKNAYQLLAPIAEITAEPIVKIIYVECLSHLLGPKNAFDWLSSQEVVKDDNEIRLNLASLAIRNREFDYALGILDSLIAKPYPGPYPYLLKAEIYVNQAAPPETIVLTTVEEIELRKNAEEIVTAIDNLEKGIALLETAGRALEIPPHANILSELYIAKGDPRSAEMSLCRNWKTLRKTGNAWFTASSIAFFKGKTQKTLARSQKALKFCKENDKEATFRFALSCMNIQEWDRCLAAINTIPFETLDTEELKAVLQIRVVCYFHKKQADSVAENLKALREKFPNDESWVVLEGVMHKQTGDLDQAIGLLCEKSKEFPNSVRIKVQLAALYREAKRYKEGFSVFSEVARCLRTTRAYEEACAVGLYAQLPEGVLSLITEAEKNPLTSELLAHFKAIALAMNKEYEKAYELFSHFPEDSLSSDDYLFYSLSVENRLNAEQAIHLLNRAKLKYPKDTRIIRSLCSLYVEINAINKAFQEAKLWLELDRTDKAPHFAVIMTGFASGEQEFAHKILMNYFSVFGEGPELRSGSIEDIKKHIKMMSQRSELLWEKYQAGQMPEAIVATEANLGLGGYRIELLKSSGRVMAFNGNSEVQKQCFFDSSRAKEVVVDYHGLITMYLLELIEPTIKLLGCISIPAAVFEKIREDLSELSLSIQQDKRKIKEEAFSKLKSMFQIYEKCPQIDIGNIPPSIGNSIYDVLVCKETGSIYVTPGFENEDGKAEKESLGVDSISVLDFIALMKEAGAISIRQYEKALTVLEKYRLKSLHKMDVTPDKALFDWNTLEMLEECGLLADVPRFVRDCGVGPFTYALLRSDIERYRRIDEIQDILRKIEAILKDLLKRGICKQVVIAGREKEGDEIPAKQKRAIKYVDTIEKTCSERDCLLWTDDLATSSLASNRGVKYTSSRTMIDVLAQKGLISEEDYVEKLIQLLKWGMYFCWINVDVIAKSAQMYSYSKSDEVMLIFKSLTAEIEGYLNHVPNEIEVNNFNVASRVMKQLWLISEKAQSLGMELFDQVLSAIGKKDLLRQYWIMVSILGMCLTGEVPLADFLRKLSLRMATQIEDELKMCLKKFIEVCLKGESKDVIRVSGKKVKVGSLIRAVHVAIPNYRDELVKFALDLDPTMRAII